MSGTVLIATPARTTTPTIIVQRHEQLVHSFRFAGGIEYRLHFNDQPLGMTKYEPNARARNEFIDRYVRPEHEWVLWLDVDVIQAPPNLIDELMAISVANGRAIVAPMVWAERVRSGKPSTENGGWFYDLGGFQDADGRFADYENGPENTGPLHEMNSVGTCYLVPAELYRKGLRYSTPHNQVEHVAFCAAARANGTRVLATRTLSVVHAYLPKYGEEWH